MTAKSKKSATPKPVAKPVAKPAAKPAAAAAPVTKKSVVMDMLKAPGGTTIDAIVANLGGSRIAAQSLIGDCKRAGAKVDKIEAEGQATVFTAA